MYIRDKEDKKKKSFFQKELESLIYAMLRQAMDEAIKELGNCFN